MKTISSALPAWLVQRLSALYMLLFLLYGLARWNFVRPVGYEAWRSWVLGASVRLPLALFLAALLLHAWVGLRDVIDHQAVSEIFDILRSRPGRLNNQTWNRRYPDYMDKIKTGSPFRVAEVLRDLTLLKSEKDLSFGERKMLDTAKNLLIKEISLVNMKEETEIEAELQELLASV